jgi:hypothetical protein
MLGMNNRTTGGAEIARRIKTWARETFDPEGAATILVSELACSEPGCPPIETVIAILRGPNDHVKYTIHRPSAEITQTDVLALANRSQGAQNHV